jgi:hypothetical protein
MTLPHSVPGASQSTTASLGATGPSHRVARPPRRAHRPRGRRGRALGILAAALAGSLLAGLGRPALAGTSADEAGHRLRSARFDLRFGDDGSVQSLKITNDLFPTEYLMNPTTAPEQAAEKEPELRQWFGNVMFSYALGTGKVTTDGVDGRPWQRAWTTASADARTVATSPNDVEVTYAGSKARDGIKDFRLDEQFSFDTDGSLVWRQTVTNTSGRPLTIGDWGVPVPGNELWKDGDKIYETRVLTRSSITGDGSYLQLGRPSGLGPSVLMLPDPGTDARWEYQDRWRTEEVGDTSWAWNQGAESSNIKGLNVYYVHSAAISRTNRGYLSSTSLALDPGASKTYAVRVTTVDGEDAVAQALYDAGMPDVAVAPGMVVPYDQSARLALRVKGAVTSVTARTDNALGVRQPSQPVVTTDGSAGEYRRFRIAFSRSHLGTNSVFVNYHDQSGKARTSVLQYRVVDRVADLLGRHAAFIVDRQQWTAADGLKPTDVRYGTFDDWIMNTTEGGLPSATEGPRGRRNRFDGYWGLGDDWGLTHAEFLAAQQLPSPDRRQIEALDTYLEYAIWRNLMGNGPGTRQVSYLVPDFWDEGHPGRGNTTPTSRGYAYPHVYNTFLSMYQVAKQNPDLIQYSHPARWYLETAYHILVELYDGPVNFNWDTGLMGEQTTPDLIEALRAEGMNREADDVLNRMTAKFRTFSQNAYPYGSEYAYDNTGEEAVYTTARLAARQTGSTKALDMMRKIVTKTRAVRGRNPVWFQYANPVTNTGENWWQFQYTIALAGYTVDDYLTHVAPVAAGSDALTPAERAELERINYGAKLGGLSLVNSGEISGHPANIGAAAWTYQAEKGNLGTNGLGGGPSVPPLNGFRGMTGESDLTLWGILRYLSADVVTDDPIFGTVGYGADVTRNTSATTIVPTDGLSRRLNLVTEGLSVTLTSDRYRRATVPLDRRGLTLDLVNTSGRQHQARVQVSGLAEGSYAVIVDGSRQSGVSAYRDDPALVAQRVDVEFTLPAGAGSTVELRPVPSARTPRPR